MVAFFVLFSLSVTRTGHAGGPILTISALYDVFSTQGCAFLVPLSSDRQHLSCDVCLEVRGEIIRTVPFCFFVLKLCTVISTLRWAVLTVLWIGFCHTGPISLCILHICCIIVSTVGWTYN